MKPVRTVIIDDEPLARENLRLRLQDMSDCDIVAECECGREALATIRATVPELVFIDVQMPDLDGFEVIEQIPHQQMPVIVFVTAYDRYALDAFKVHALDYLLKPFSESRFTEAWEHACQQVIQQRRSASQDMYDKPVNASLERPGNQPSSPYADRLVIRSRGCVSFLKILDIDWLEANGDYVRVHSQDGTFLLRKTMAEMEARLGASGFSRINRSVIVNLDRVEVLTPLTRGQYQVEMSSGVSLKLTRSYRTRLETLMGDHF